MNNKETSAPRVRVIGLGQTGIHILDEMVLRSGGMADLLALDTDAQTLESSVVTEKILLGSKMTRGLGCGGELELAEAVAKAEKEELRSLISGIDYLLLTFGLGSGTGNAFGATLLELAKKEGIKVVALVSLPFAFEGRRRLQYAISSLEKMRAEADSVLVFANDRLAELEEGDNLRPGFHLLNQSMARGVESLIGIFSSRNLIQLDFADVRSLFGRYLTAEPLENSWCAFCETEKGVEAEAIVEQLLAGPLLSEEIWQEADCGLCTLTGGSDLALAEVQNIFEELRRVLPKNFSISTGAHLEENYGNKLRLTLLLAKTKPMEMISPQSEEKLKADLPVDTKKKGKKPRSNLTTDQTGAEEGGELSEAPLFAPVEEGFEETAAAASSTQVKGKAKKHKAKQEELPFETAHRGRFENSFETIYNGENLDQPTFRRRRLKIRL